MRRQDPQRSSAGHGTSPVPTDRNDEVTLRVAAESVEPTSKPGPKCGIHILRMKLDTDDNNWLDDVLPSTSGKKSSWISDVLKSDGHDVSEFIIQRHRRGKCSCVVSE